MNALGAGDDEVGCVPSPTELGRSCQNLDLKRAPGDYVEITAGEKTDSLGIHDSLVIFLKCNTGSRGYVQM